MATLSEAIALQQAVLGEILSCSSDDANLASTIEQQTAALQGLLANLRASEQTVQVSQPEPTPPDPPQPAQDPNQPPQPNQAPVQDPPADGKTKELPQMGGDLAATAREFRSSWTQDEYARIASDVGSEVASAFDRAAQGSKDGDVIEALSVLRGKNDIAARMQKVLGDKMAPASALFVAAQT